MSAIVLDASVAVKWFLPVGGEPLVEEAMAFGERYEAGAFSLIVPDLFWAEVTNFFWKGVQQGRFTPAFGTTALEALKSTGLPTIPSFELLSRAFEIALNFHRSVYDSLYLALAIRLGTELITADEKLVNAVGSRLPVKWLGAL